MPNYLDTTGQSARSMHRSFDEGRPCYPLAPRPSPSQTEVVRKNSMTDSERRNAMELPRCTAPDCWKHELSSALLAQALDDETHCFACDCDDSLRAIQTKVLDDKLVASPIPASISLPPPTRRPRSNALLPPLSHLPVNRITPSHPPRSKPESFRTILRIFWADFRRRRRGEVTNEEFAAWVLTNSVAAEGWKRKFRTGSMPSEWSSPVASVSTFELDAGVCGECGRRVYGFCICWEFR